MISMKTITFSLCILVCLVAFNASVFAQENFVAHIVEFEVANKAKDRVSFTDAFSLNPIQSLQDFRKTLEKGQQLKAIRILLEKSAVAESGEKVSLVPLEMLDLKTKKGMVAQVPSLLAEVTPHLLDADGQAKRVQSTLHFERNVIDKSIPAGDLYIVTDTRSYKTSITSAFDQVTVLGGGRTPKEDNHYLAIYFTAVK
jgi:hypothetical protein